MNLNNTVNLNSTGLSEEIDSITTKMNWAFSTGAVREFISDPNSRQEGLCVYALEVDFPDRKMEFRVDAMPSEEPTKNITTMEAFNACNVLSNAMGNAVRGMSPDAHMGDATYIHESIFGRGILPALSGRIELRDISIHTDNVDSELPRVVVVFMSKGISFYYMVSSKQK